MAAPSHSTPWNIITSLRWDPQLQNNSQNPSASSYYMLHYHQERMLSAADDFGWGGANEALKGPIGMANLTNALDSYVASSALAKRPHLERSLKLRVLLAQDGCLTITSVAVPEVGIQSLLPTTLPASISDVSRFPVTWLVFIAPICTVPSLYTKHKTTHRPMYDEVRKYIPSAARLSASGETAEILLVNEEDAIMEGSITTPYFLRDGRWITPPENAGGNRGTTRRWALENGLCVEETIAKSDLKIGEVLWLSNGVRGWGVGIIADLST